ncbi:MAG: hydroxyethylthiazole kinase [Deltaproteobacteria bacterium]|jgi:hydroxyethylthiazole kinase|nr:hydroxyethylthiazole kinase [Deltaproteobacteria bacterium]
MPLPPYGAARRPEPEILQALARARKLVPLVHCLTASVARELMANVVLALGGSPAMIAADEEIEQFVPLADALVINLGSLSSAGAQSMRRAAALASSLRKPWLFDPAAVGALSLRTELARDLLALRPDIVKGNASEILALAGEDGKGRCADATVEAELALEAAGRVAGRTGRVTMVTGATDYVTDGLRLMSVPGGHPLMSRVTGTGCALGAAAAVFLGAGLPLFRAAVTASAVFAFAGAKAGEEARGPGGFAAAFLDQLYLLGEGS